MCQFIICRTQVMQNVSLKICMQSKDNTRGLNTVYLLKQIRFDPSFTSFMAMTTLNTTKNMFKRIKQTYKIIYK